MNKYIGIGLSVIALIGGIIFFTQRNGQASSILPLKKEIALGHDVCSEFPKEWVESVLKKSILKTNTSSMNGLYVCKYYVDENNFVTLRLNDLNFESQKKGQQALGRSITTNPSIQLNHFIAIQGDNLINNIVLEINPNTFLAVDRSSPKAANETEIVEFASSVAERIQKGENQGLGSEPTKVVKAKNVPLPQDKDIVQNFFTFIDEGKASDAVLMMTSTITKDDSVKQAFGVQFAAMNSIKVKKIEESSSSDWTDTWHQYMVTLDVVMDPRSASGPIPYYGYEKGENVRFVTLVKEQNVWKIEGLSTGP